MRNIYRVPKEQWNKWSEAAKGVFNELYEVMSKNQRHFRHPNMFTIPSQQWLTVAWNAAWYAADATDTWNGVVGLVDPKKVDRAA